MNANTLLYCKFENFRENFIFAKIVERHTCICGIKSLRLELGLPISVNNREISPFRKGLFYENLNPRENFRIYSIQHKKVEI